jgi:hypothetical protein
MVVSKSNYTAQNYRNSRVHAVLGQAGVESADGITVRVGMAEEYFEGAGRHKDELERMKDEIQDRSIT